MKVKRLCIAFMLAIIAPFQANADAVTDVVNDVAAKLVSQLPMEKKIALKSLSPDETGLPEDFLQKLTSDLEAALLTASDFEINLANRATMEDVWQEAVEFNNADFDELFKNANADVMLMISPRAISTGVEIAITAYALTGDSVGQTLASSGSVLLPIDLQANLGVDVNDLNQQMSQVLAEIEKVGQTGGLISDPNTYAEYYHNARILQQRGEVDLAMRNYEMLFKDDLIFLDTALDFSDLLVARYGETGAKKYISNRLVGSVSSIAELILANLLADTLPVPDYSNLEQRDRSLAWASWLITASKREIFCGSHRDEVFLPSIRFASVCSSAWAGYSFLTNKLVVDVSSIYIDDIRSLRLMQDLGALFSYSETNFEINRRGVLPATLLVKPSEDELAFVLWRLYIPQLLFYGSDAEICFESSDGKSHCQKVTSGSGLALRTALKASNEIGFIVPPPAKISNIELDITCILSVRIKDQSKMTVDLPIFIMAPSYAKKSFNKEDFDFIDRLRQCETPLDLVRINNL